MADEPTLREMFKQQQQQHAQTMQLLTTLVERLESSGRLSPPNNQIFTPSLPQLQNHTLAPQPQAPWSSPRATTELSPAPEPNATWSSPQVSTEPSPTLETIENPQLFDTTSTETPASDTLNFPQVKEPGVSGTKKVTNEAKEVAVMVPKKGEICHTCGGTGNLDLLVNCHECKSISTHLYCLKDVRYEFPEQWYCEECTDHEKDYHGIIPVDAQKNPGNGIFVRSTCKQGEAQEKPKLSEVFYEVEAIRKKRYCEGQLQYRIKWANYLETDNTWEPYDNIKDGVDMIEAFEQSLRSRKRKRKRFYTSNRKHKRKNASIRVLPMKSSSRVKIPNDLITSNVLNHDENSSLRTSFNEPGSMTTVQNSEQNSMNSVIKLDASFIDLVIKMGGQGV